MKHCFGATVLKVVVARVELVTVFTTDLEVRSLRLSELIVDENSHECLGNLALLSQCARAHTERNTRKRMYMGLINILRSADNDC